MNPLKKGVKTVSNLLTVGLLIVLVLVIYGRLTVTFSENSYPNYFGYTFFEVSSGSMEPALSVNDVILVKIGYDNYKKGDIITYVNDKGEIITHRIVIVNADTLTVKGDANNTIDTPIQKSQVIGKVERVYPQLSVWQKVITEPKILMVLFITLLAFDFALSYDGEKDKGKSTTKKKVIISKEKEEKKELEEIKEIEEKKEKVKENKITSVKPETPRIKVNDSIDVDALLDFTKKIDLEEINKALDKTVKLNKKEMTELKEKIDSIDEKKPVLPKLEQKEREFIEYTIRLDLKAIQKNVKNKGK